MAEATNPQDIKVSKQQRNIANEVLNPLPQQPKPKFGQETKGFGAAVEKGKEFLWGDPESFRDINDILSDYRDGKITIRQRNEAVRAAGDSVMQSLVQNYGPFYATALNFVKDTRQYFDHVLAISEDVKKGYEKRRAKGENIDPTAEFLATTAKVFARQIMPEMQMLFSYATSPMSVGGASASDLTTMMGFGPKTAQLAELLVNTGVMVGPLGKSLVRSQASIGDAMNAAGRGIKSMAHKATEPIVGEAKAIPTGLEGYGGMGAELGSASVDAQITQAAAEAVAENLRLSGVGGKTLASELRAKIKSLATEPDLATRLANFKQETELQARGVKGMVRGHAAAVESAQGLPDYVATHYRPLNPGTVLNQEKSLKLNGTVHQWVADFLEKSDQYLAGDKSIYQSLKADFGNLLTPIRDVDAALREGGRAGEIMKELSDPRYLRRFWEAVRAFDPVAFAQNGEEAAFTKLLENLKQIGTPDEIRRFLQTTMEAMKGNTSTIADNVHTAFLSILFAKPATWVKKASGDVLGTVDSIIQKSAAGYMSENQINGVMAHEGTTQFKATMLALQDSIGQAFGKQQFMGPKDIGEVTKGLPNFMEQYSTPEWAVPLKVFESITDFAQAINIKAGVYGYYWREGMRQGLKGGALTDFIAKESQMPSLAAVSEAADMALENTFLAPLGKFGQAMRSVTQGIPYVGPYIFPVFKIGANLTNRALSNVPGVNLLTRGMLQGLAEGGRARDLVLGRLLMADVAAYFMSGMTKMGLMTGSGPSVQPGENQVWRMAGNPFHAVNLGGDWFNYDPLEPLGKTAAVAADIAYNADYIGETDMLNLGSAAGSAILKDSLQSSYWPVFTDMVRYFENLQKGDILTGVGGLLAVMAAPATGALGGGPVVSTAQREADPYQHNLQSEWDRFKLANPITNALIPTVLDKVPYQHDMFTGEKVPMPAPWGTSWFPPTKPVEGKVIPAELTPFTVTPDQQNPRYKLANDLGVKFPRTDYVIAGKNAQVPYGDYNPQDGPQIRLNEEQQADYVHRMATLKTSKGQTFADKWDEIAKDPQFQKAHVDDKRLILQGIVEAYSSAAKEGLFKDRPDLQMDRLDPQVQKYLSHIVDPEERAAKEQEITKKIMGDGDPNMSLSREAVQ